jgi:amino acid permease
MKNFIKHISLVQLFLTLKNTEKEYWMWLLKGIFRIISPLLFVFIVFNGLLLVAAFIGWQWPNHFYIPFMGSSLQGHFDRLMLIIGIIIAFSKDE